ncbi:MAG: hypothetical protein AAFO04_30120, partial [Cyanobacteria bacterium J06592_8]
PTLDHFGSTGFQELSFFRQNLIRFGGIRSQLKQLQADHLAYVEAHGQRLEARLQENRKHKSKVLADIEVLQKELDDLIAEAEAEAEEE